MPSEKSARSSERKRLTNRRIRSATRTIVGKAASALETGVEQEAESAVMRATRTLDMAASKGIIHRNTAAGKKSRLMRKLNALKPK